MSWKPFIDDTNTQSTSICGLGEASPNGATKRNLRLLLSALPHVGTWTLHEPECFSRSKQSKPMKQPAVCNSLTLKGDIFLVVLQRFVNEQEPRLNQLAVWLAVSPALMGDLESGVRPLS